MTALRKKIVVTSALALMFVGLATGCGVEAAGGAATGGGTVGGGAAGGAAGGEIPAELP